MTNRVSSYIMTYVPGDESGLKMLNYIKASIKDHNNRVREDQFFAPSRRSDLKILRICQRGRFGKNNPNRAKYGKYWQHGWCRLEDAARIDVYVYIDYARSYR